MGRDGFSAALSPESVGIPSSAILRFLQRIDSERICMHGFLLVRHNRIAAEGYWAPWSADRKHRMYSVSKSFASLGVGLMIDEGKLSLDDRVADFFPMPGSRFSSSTRRSSVFDWNTVSVRMPPSCVGR